MKDEKTLAWLTLYFIPGLGNNILKRLIENLREPEAVLEASLSGLMKISGVREDIARKIVGRAFEKEAEKELRAVGRCGARIIGYTDPSYPGLLREIHSPPMLLYVKGQDVPLSQTFIGVVGSRQPSHYGLNAAEKIGVGLAKRGVGVVSGLARGIDSAAHRGCLKGNGFTIAVLGTGIDRVYPSSNRGLFEQVTQSGVVVSEFPTSSPPEPRNFPIRNRIISGLSRGIAVVEATKNSGSLITASLALDQGREVFAVPGSINSFKSTGTHYLIKQGAKLIENADDILDEFVAVGRGVEDRVSLSGAAGTFPDMDKSEKKVYEMMSDYPVHIDHIVRVGDMGVGEVAGILMKMELKGLIRQLPGKMYIR